jgi:hypothetical protein
MDPAIALLMLRLIDLVAAGLELAPELIARKAEYVAKIEAMLAEDRGPNDEEMDELLAESAALTAAVAAALDARRAAGGS